MTSATFTVNQGGTLVLDNSANNNTNRISDTLAFTLTGGELVFRALMSRPRPLRDNRRADAHSGDSTVTMYSGTGGSTTRRLPVSPEAPEPQFCSAGITWAPHRSRKYQHDVHHFY